MYSIEWVGNSKLNVRMKQSVLTTNQYIYNVQHMHKTCGLHGNDIVCCFSYSTCI